MKAIDRIGSAFLRRILLRMKELGVSQTDLAQRMKVSRPYITKVLHSHVNISFRTAAKLANADSFIRRLPQGYQTMLSGNGTNLSQGQRQLLTIARAIVADPLVLILDEAISSVDTMTELEIQKAMDELMKGRTSFIIAHRLSTIRDADCILVMDKGTIVEQGNHDELMRKNGFYADLYNSQFA